MRRCVDNFALDALARVTAPLRRRDKSTRMNPRGYLRLQALDRVIAWGFDIPLRNGFHEKRQPRVVYMRIEGTTMSSAIEYVSCAPPLFVAERSRDRRTLVASLDKFGDVRCDFARAWTGPATKAKWEARRAFVAAGAVNRARAKLFDEAGVNGLWHKYELADVVECLGVGSLGALAIDALLRAGIFDDIEEDLHNFPTLFEVR